MALTFKTNLNPDGDLTRELGSASARWKINGVTPVLTDTVTTVTTTGTGNAVTAVSASDGAITVTKGTTFSTTTGTVRSITLTAGTGIELSASGAITTTGSRTISLASGVITAGSAGPSADASPAFGSGFSVPYVTVDTYGRVTALSTKTVTIPSSTATTGNSGVNGLMTSGQATKLAGIADNATKNIAATAAPPAISSASATGDSTNYARQNHTHEGVTSVNGSKGVVTLQTLTIGDKVYNGSSSATITAQDLNIAASMTFKGIVTNTINDGASTPTNLTTVGGQGVNVTSSTPGWVVISQPNGEEYIWDGAKWNALGLATSFAIKNHTHGNINSNGTLSTAVSSVSGTKIVVTDSTNAIIQSNVSFGSSGADTYLRNDGAWGTTVTSTTAGLLDSTNFNKLVSAAACYVSAGAGISVSTTATFGGTSGVRTITNAGVRSIGTSGDYLTVNTNGTTSTVTVPYATTASTATYDSASNNISTTYVKKSGDTMTGNLYMRHSDAKSSAMSTASYRGIYILENSGNDATNRTGIIYNMLTTGGASHMRLYAYDPTAGSSATCYFGPAYIANGPVKRTYTDCQIYGAVWNDYAEYRKDNLEESELQKPGRCVKEIGDGRLTLTTKRLERGCEIISDTFGFAIGQDEKRGYNTPIASNGRVLAYIFEGREAAANHIGWPVCSGPNGTVSIMTEAEEEQYPSRIIGIISEIPDYDEWGEIPVKVNDRIWIRVR